MCARLARAANMRTSRGRASAGSAQPALSLSTQRRLPACVTLSMGGRRARLAHPANLASSRTPGKNSVYCCEGCRSERSHHVSLYGDLSTFVVHCHSTHPSSFRFMMAIGESLCSTHISLILSLLPDRPCGAVVRLGHVGPWLVRPSPRPIQSRRFSAYGVIFLHRSPSRIQI